MLKKNEKKKKTLKTRRLPDREPQLCNYNFIRSSASTRAIDRTLHQLDRRGRRARFAFSSNSTQPHGDSQQNKTKAKQYAPALLSARFFAEKLRVEARNVICSDAGWSNRTTRERLVLLPVDLLRGGVMESESSAKLCNFVCKESGKKFSLTSGETKRHQAWSTFFDFCPHRL